MIKKLPKVLLYNNKIFLNARSFYEFVLTHVYDGEEPTGWKLDYIHVCWSNRIKTISGVKVDWVSISEEDYNKLKSTEKGWMKWTEGSNLSFTEFIREMNVEFTKEDLWRWVVEYTITYDTPRLKMKSLVSDVLSESEVSGKIRGVQVHRMKEK